MIYPYFLLPGQPRSAEVPLVKVIYKHQIKQTTPIHALIDSGAQISFAPIDLALWLGIKVDQKKYLDIRGFNNTITRCYPGLVTVEIEKLGNSFEIPVYFGGLPSMQCILGQDPFFDIAKISFERYSDSFSIDLTKKRARLN